jgi:hypothetical protein
MAGRNSGTSYTFLKNWQGRLNSLIQTWLPAGSGHISGETQRRAWNIVKACTKLTIGLLNQ